MAALPELILDMMAWPYRLGGRGPGGVDCLGLTLAVLQRIGIPAPDPWRDIHTAWRSGSLDAATGFGSNWRRIEPSDVGLDGDVLLFDVGGCRAAHVAVLFAGHVAHAASGIGVNLRPWTLGHERPAQAWRYQQ